MGGFLWYLRFFAFFRLKNFYAGEGPILFLTLYNV